MNMGDRRRELWMLVGVLALAFGIRLAWVLVMDPHQMRPSNWDSVWYFMRAKGLAAGDGYLGHHGQPTAYFAPGYPALLALMMTCFGDAAIVPKLFNVFAGTLTCLFVFGIGKRAFGSGIGLLGALLMALCPGDIAFTGLQLSELAFVCFFTGSILVYFPAQAPLDRGSPLRSGLFGFALGIAGLVRGIGLPFLPVGVAVSLYARGLRRDSLKSAALICAGLLLAAGPWMVRNAVVMNAPGMITADGPLALLMAHAPASTGTHSLGMHSWRKEQLAEYAELPYPEREVEEARAMTRLALSHALTHPLWELSMVPRRLYHFVSHDHAHTPASRRAFVTT
jgi:4-amino-4-deoxy-L-arabinose transferase-like glycosyltransferase